MAFDSPAECRYPRKATTTYHARTKKFTGRVFSEWTPCTVDQKVQVFRQAKGPDEKLGTTWTGADGRFVLSKRLRKGGAYALAPSSSSAQTGRCLPARSILTH